MTSSSNLDTRPAQSAARPAPFESRFIEAGGVRLHYLDYGTEGLTPMLCLHGGAVNAHWFDFVAAGFTASCPHVELVEVPGADHHVTLDNPGGSSLP